MTKSILSSPEVRDLDRMQREVLDRIDDDFRLELGEVATNQFVEVVEGLFIPNKKGDLYRLTRRQWSSEDVPVFFAKDSSEEIFVGCRYNDQTSEQVRRSKKILRGEDFKDVPDDEFRAVMGKIETLAPDDSSVIRLMQRAGTHGSFAVCDVYEREMLLSDDRKVAIYGRPAITLRRDTKRYYPILGHEGLHASRRLHQPLVIESELDPARQRLESELRSYTVQHLLEQGMDEETMRYMGGVADFVVNARSRFEDPNRPFAATDQMLEHFQKNRMDWVYTPAS